MATRSAKIDQKADLIWAIADKLTGVYKPHEYGDVILPLTVIRRFDCILSDTKDAVLQKYDEVKNLPMKDILLRKASKKDFYNTSKYTFERLMDDPDHIEENFREYLNKFSANVRDILEKFKFDGHITTMANKGILYIVLKEYTTDRGNLHPNEISNLEMGYIFEEIIRRFSESHNEDAGQHYTPREVIQLGIFCDYGLSIPEYVSLAVKLKEQKSVSRLGNRNDDAEENDKDDSDAGDIGNIRFWNLPIYHDDWRDNLTIELTQEEAFYLDKQIQKSTKGSLLEYVLKNRIDLNEYDDFASLTAELSEKVGEKLAYMMKLACDFNNLVYMARVRYNVMLSEDENTYANDEWSRLLPDIRHNATVDLDAVFGEFQLINPRAKSFLCGIQAAFITLDIDMADELIRKRERSLKGAARAKLSRTKEFDHSKWVGGGMLDYRFSNARRIVNDIYAGEVSADV
ncbi:type I restriction-modification system subunit M N-terminal domain-containing protein [[Clostridium] scindens]|uniref:type I restriction-modification system subunit M N-terminal domain-containing protein n=1 Tax=Clostridium scindens (strain JCM 10418 / VPI 12708) TaxID=29347 RepID=UPI001D0771E6|nr:type I restriction-modification system subunit M N-terminal domain-containing protein [[Clostridium] scindens]MCB6422732.1 type I restriction-modification system subunit M N-terminal domain-containing protein [[Clostridium] scindens]MCG4930764.1 type I restriction-modification system subunit M N-terminal domain-containing protein [[Clostridium] scindens]